MTSFDDTVSSEVYCYDRSITGQPSAPNRVHRASVSSWERGLSRSRAVGTAFDGNEPVLTARGGATVLVTRADGSREYVPASSFSRSGSRQRRATTAEMVDRQNVRDARRVRTSADLPAVQNYETDA